MAHNLRKGVYCTDVHFGKKGNSDLHNQDCLRFLDWFCEQAKEENADYVGFLGDWHEHRSALNVATLTYSYQGAKKLNDLGLPVYFCVGNHDLYHRHSRETYSVVPFHEFNNFIIVNEPMIAKNIGNGALFSPYLFHEEYSNLQKYLKIPFWAGHFEFKGFVITGYNITMKEGPDPNLFKGPKFIFSGHFHKRQHQGNVHYIGNTFPMDFSDSGDNNRGLMMFDHLTDKITYKNWDDSPKYIKTKLTDILDKKIIIPPGARVKCEADEVITYEEMATIRETFLKEYELREFTMEESRDLERALTDTESELDPENMKLDTIDELVMKMLQEIKSDQIDNEKLVKIYRSIGSK